MKYFFFLFLPILAQGQNIQQDTAYIRLHYQKTEQYITMRDGVRLFTSIYAPRDQSEQYPFLLERTPYSCEPYGAEQYPGQLSSDALSAEQYIFVYQDVRGRYKSEGNFLEMTPHNSNKQTPQDVDESSDTYDTVQWLLSNVDNNNGNVGIMGISYPGFYASAALPEAHPAIKAVSPQAPVTDEFEGDDAYHNGAFFLMDNFLFSNYFDAARPGPVEDYKNLFRYASKDAYAFFLNLKTLKNTDDQYFKQGKIWKEYLEHATYDAYWKARNIRPHLKNIKPAVLVVGGWLDAEDLFGALNTYRAIEQQTPGNDNRLVMGPWTHGAWARDNWDKFGTYNFGSNTSKYYQDRIEAPFFKFYLKNKGQNDLAEANVFDAGINEWHTYDQWPPRNSEIQRFFLHDNGNLNTQSPVENRAFDEYISDPKHPVPYAENYQGDRNNLYMAADQRFAERRPDVLTYQTPVLTEDLTLSGQLVADLFVSTTGTDADFIVKVIDVLVDSSGTSSRRTMSLEGYERLVRANIMRGKFRNGLEKPEPFKPGKVAEVRFELNDVAYTFRKGHRLMLQIQSSWYPLADLNPQKFTNIPSATEQDFQKAMHRIYRTEKYPSHVEMTILK